MDMNKCKINLDSPNNIYYSGQKVNGQISLQFDKKTKIKGIKCNLAGRFKCKWVQLSKPNTVYADKKTSLVYSNSKSIIGLEKYVFGSETARPHEFDQGEQNFTFQFHLYPELKSSFEGKYGSIKYKIRVTIIRPWSFDDKFEKAITVVMYSCPPIIRNGIPEVIKSPNIGLIGGGPIELAAKLNAIYVVRGKLLYVNADIDNKSSVHVEKLKFTVFQSIKYFRADAIGCQREEIRPLVKKETGEIQKKTKRSFAYELQLPCCLPSDDEVGSPFRITYFVQVKVLLSGLHKKLTAILPFRVCSYDDIGNRIPSIIMFPEVDSSDQTRINYESPTHSSFNGERGSRNSTASDLSTVTLSPNASTVLTRNTSASTSSSVRGSLRNSIGFRIENQPMNNSYPRRNTISLLPQNFVTSSPQSVPRVPVMAQHLNESPPSYEELFGNFSLLDSNHNQSPSAPPLFP